VLFCVGFRTGLRLGEILALEWGDIDFVKRRVRVERSHHRGHTTSTKADKVLNIPVTKSVVEALKSYRHLKGDLVFSRKDGEHLNRDMIKHPFERVMKAAGLHRIRIHDMRHSFASQLVMAGVPLKAVAEFLGHSDTRITDRYAHLAPQVAESYIELLDEPGGTRTGDARRSGKRGR
jgi:integrase